MSKPVIHIILNQPYPIGMACTNRVHLYAKGLISCGCQIKIILPVPLERPDQINNKSFQGSYDGVSYQSAWNSPVRSRSFWGRRVHDILSPLIAAWISFREHPDSILLVSTRAYHTILFKIVTLLLGAGYFLERSELPFFTQTSLNWYQKLYIRSIYPLFDGLIVISDSLLTFFKPLLKKGAVILQVPILVDVSEIYMPDVKSRKTLVYTGPLTQHKDGIITIIESFVNIASEFPEYILQLTGDLSASPDREHIQKMLEDSGLRDRIKLLGFVDRIELRKILNQATVLLLAKPSNRQNSACFPTKLGEYLATGNPVLTTNVGEISSFLSNNVTAFLSEPTVHDFTACLRFVLSDLDNARRVGVEGQTLANNQFDYLAYTNCLVNFLNSGKKMG